MSTLFRVKHLIFAIIFSIITLLILGRISNLEIGMIPQFFSVLGGRGIFILSLLTICFFCVDALRLKTMALAGERDLPFNTALLCALSGSFLTNISPFFLGAGFLYSGIFMLKGLSWPVAISLVVAGSFFNHMVHFGLGLAILLLHQDLPQAMSSAKWYLFFIYFSIVSLFSLSLLFKKRVIEYLKDRGNIGEVLIQAISGFTILWKLDRRYLLLLFTASTIYFFSFYGVAVYIFKTFVPDTPYLLIYPLQLASYLLSLPLPTPGATGGVELASLSAFSLLAPMAIAGQVVIIWRIVIYYLPLLLGGPALFILSIREGIKREDFNRERFTIKKENESEVQSFGSNTSFPTCMSRLWKKNGR